MKVDKGKCIFVMERTAYDEKMNNLLNDSSIY